MGRNGRNKAEYEKKFYSYFEVQKGLSSLTCHSCVVIEAFKKKLILHIKSHVTTVSKLQPSRDVATY